ncbi:Uma2 family endonuclease [Natronosporangium hydrolyticum]|uniref:Uma2 family endonuclease n=1 Tax=Natronosporangium hydrolyticum TaxID=2811111 RepID=A0A895YP06_9ACTN|nr:Uma2 family endonuclease [Natronosporangium hydrolyticum]QSB15850.1 Uma2 family endonuclease [Natronosporangium hydrolyticum]
MAAPAFDPLVDLDGLWTTALADRFLPDPQLPSASYESVNGRLFVSPTEVHTNSWGELKLARLVADAAESAGFSLSGPVNLKFDEGTWIQPDLTVLHTLPKTDEEDRWVPSAYCTMVVEFVSRSNRRKDFVATPDLCAKGGVPYFLRVELVRRLSHASAQLFRLTDGRYEPVVEATAGQVFEAVEPFPMRFDPRQLLP